MQLNLAETVVIKEENLFLIALRDARLPAEAPHPLGLWYRDCRFLSTHELRLNGTPALLLQASDALGTRALHELTNREQVLSLHLERGLDDPRRLRERISLRSHHDEQLRLTLELRLAADFVPMLEVRGLVPPMERAPVDVELDRTSVRFSARGRDGVVRATLVDLSEEPTYGAAPEGSAALRFEIDLPAGAEHVVELGFVVSETGEGASPPARRASACPPTVVSSDDRLFDRVLARSLRDLELLRSELDGQAYFAAGVPWFATLFGRDSLITATETLAFVPEVAEETLRLLGGLLGRTLDDARDEEPGKVLHELRVGEPATLGETPFARYYGSVDATPLWLCLLRDHADWSGTLHLFRELRTQVDAALGWMEHHGDLDGDGLLEYRRGAPSGLVNQGWKDSPDGVPDAAGQPLEAPVAVVEVQGYAIRALRGTARLFELDGEPARGAELRERATTIETALERLWLADAASYAIALDGDKRPGSGLTSNQGHLLWAGAVSDDRARSIRDVLMGPRMLSGWGVRTLAEGHPRFNPLGYHIGSVWPHDNALIAAGLRGYGFDQDFTRVFEALLEAASLLDAYRLPELFAGYPRAASESPVPYPVACRPQAWAAGAIPYLLTSGLGLSPDGLSRRLRIVRPSLPSWLDRVELSGLRVAGASVDLRFERAGERVTLADARVDGELEVLPS